MLLLTVPRQSQPLIGIKDDAHVIREIKENPTISLIKAEEIY